MHDHTDIYFIHYNIDINFMYDIFNIHIMHVHVS